ncbi:MAG: iron-containing alcohol dehydrogenase [Treponemataceae bacterium]|nr:iron-containing alcohol dehydrogenase [Treponemataceae bacterium]
MADFIFKISPNIMLGTYLSSRLGQYAKDYANRFMVIIDSALQKTDIEAKLRTTLEDSKIDFFVYKEVPANPDSSTLEKVLWLAREAKIKGVIAVGSDNTTNFGKAVAMFYYQKNDVYSYIDNTEFENDALPFICLSTNLHDKFLFSNRVLVVDARNRKTVLLKSKKPVCDLVVIDPDFNIKNGEHQKFLDSMNCLNLALETYVSQKANFFSDMLIEKAVSLLAAGLKAEDGLEDNQTSAELLSESGVLVSLAAASSGYGAVSALSTVMQGRFQIDSSFSTAILMSSFIEDCSKIKLDKIAKIAKMMNVSTEADSEEQAKTNLINYINDLLSKNNIPSKLKSLSVAMEQLASVAENAGNLDIIEGFHRSMNADDLFELVKQAY